MGDRVNPIKFGPEWLRNLSSEPTSPGARDAGAGAAPPGLGARAVAANSNSSKVLLARLRYGREEMLALYDRETAEAPSHLKTNDILYQPRAKPPYALNNTFEEEPRDSSNRQPPGGVLMGPSDRYMTGGRGRGGSMGDSKSRGLPLEIRGKSRGYNRPSSGGRGWHGNRAAGAYSGIPDDDPNLPLRPWSSSNHPSSAGMRPISGEQPDWQTKQTQYRIKRQTSTNWRQQHGRGEGEEWRSSEGPRRPQDKFAEWGWQQEPSGRPNQDKQWHSNRRTWIGGEASEDPLPEWAVENSETCGGTFDSSGAFHGYSNDDSNLPKNQENPYPLTKSHTHGSFARAKMAEEGSEEWWASEKAKKLSPKRFDASDIQFKKQLGPGNADEDSDLNATQNTGSNEPVSHNTGAIPKRSYQTISSTYKKPKEKSSKTAGIKNENKDISMIKTAGTNAAATGASDENNKTVDTSMEKVLESHLDNEKQNEMGNVQSVILTSNNSLRHKHQSITPTETPKRQPKLLEYMETANARQLESDVAELETRKDTDSNKIVEDILQMSLDDNIPSATINQLLTSHSNSSMNTLPQVPYPSIQMRMANTLQGLGLNAQNMQNPQLSAMQNPEAYSGMMQPIGMTNSMLNASLGLPLPNPSNGMMQGISPSLSNPGLAKLVPNLQGLHMQGLQGFGLQPSGAIQNQLGGLPNNNLQAAGPGLQSATNPMSAAVANSALFNNIQHANNLPNNGTDNAQQLLRLQQLASQSFNMIYGGNMMNQPPPINNMGLQQMLSDLWYYEDPNKTIQGPFSSKEMYYWYRAGFFNPTLMVRRECEATMRPLGTYGLMPFGVMDMISPFPMGGGYDLRPQQSNDNLMNPQPGLGVDVQSLWSPSGSNVPVADRMWVASMGNELREHPVNDLPLHFWNNQASDLPAPPLLPEKMKTEEDILAQMRATQAQGPTSPLSFFAESPIAAPEVESTTLNVGLINQLQQIIEKEPTKPAAADLTETEQVPQKTIEAEAGAVSAAKSNKTVDKTAEVKQTKELPKIENAKQKSKDNIPKPKVKKTKDDKKEETIEVKPKDEETKVEKRSAEPSPTKGKKEDKSSKKDLDKEKKEWIKEGFTIVKSADKSKDKESKKKAEDAKAAEEAERKSKEEERLLAEEKKRQLDFAKKIQDTQSQQVTTLLRQVAETASKKAPWSAASLATPTPRDGPTLTEIQRLEREKKLEQMKEQQQMMQIIAQQQAAAMAREQELQAGLGWAKTQNTVNAHQTLAEIQAEARKQALVMTAALTSREEAEPTPPPTNVVPWANVNNGGEAFLSGGFWDSPMEPVKPVAKPAEMKPESKNKKKVTVMMPPKPETTPAIEFELWCTNMLATWRETGIDVPTFVSFLKDIESPYEVKDYVKCYLGDSRDASEFARHFLEKRSRLLRVGMVTPSDDLCSPAVAVNPRTNSGSDHADLKTKGKKTKKNKMLKVDARNILGFSVTASEDRINVGDIDTV